MRCCKWNIGNTIIGKILELKQLYNKISKQTQNRLQEIFDTFVLDFNSLYSIVNIKTKNRIKWKLK